MPTASIETILLSILHTLFPICPRSVPSCLPLPSFFSSIISRVINNSTDSIDAQLGQFAALARTPDTLRIDVCCVSETRIQDSSRKAKIDSAPGLKKPYWLYTSGDDQSLALGRAGVGIAFSSRAISSLVD